MNPLSTLIRHAVTYLAGIGTYLYQVGAIDASGVDAANAAGASMQDGTAILLSLVAVVATRWAINLLGKIFPATAAKLTGGAGSGLPLPVILCGAAAGLLGLSLPSCSADQLSAARAIPVRIGIAGPQGTLSYSSKSGLELSARVHADK